ncbi:MAG: ABC transporter permease [Phycisphaerae bacterium]|nr:ABC transporter permease [Phycisphaerae bacterium]
MKALHVAWREFCSTVLTKGFILGVFLPPLIGVIGLMALPMLMNQKPPKTEGRVGVVDRSGVVMPLLEREFTPERLQERRRRTVEEAKAKAQEAVPTGMGGPSMEGAFRQMETIAGEGPKLSLQRLPADADVEAIKKDIPKATSRAELPKDPLLALAVIPAESVSRADGASYEKFTLFTTPTLDVEVKGDVENAIERAIVDARLVREGLDASKVRALLSTPRSDSITITQGGERKTHVAVQMLLPGAFLFLIWISVFVAGQSLLTTTIEEKSNRVMEVLLSAVSPMQLMLGKIIGQMAVAGVILGVYAGIGVVALVVFALTHLVNPWNIIWIAGYFLIAFFLIACMMAAIGSAVSELREAQALMGPIMVVLIIPMVLWMPILRNPNSLFATVLSFVPPVSPFVMVLRLGGSERVDFWQIPASLAVGVLSVVVACWATAKIFRIGVLMYGKPPNFATLLRWIRMA